MSMEVVYSEVVFVKNNDVDNNNTNQCQSASEKSEPCGCDSVRLLLLALCALLTAGLIAFSFQYVCTEKKLKDLQRLHSALKENFTAELQDMYHWQQNLSKVLNDGVCPKDWEYHAGKCYLFSKNELNWTESRDSCITDGGHLVIINRRNEQEFLMRKIKQKKKNFWIGLTDEKIEDHWLWVDNTELNKSIRYWIQNEPDDWKGTQRMNYNGEDCVIITPESNPYRSWSDAFCNKLFFRICETRSSAQT